MLINRYRSTLILPIKLFFVFVLFFCILNSTEAQDDRSYQHGINFLQRPDNQWLLIWSSSGNPPAGKDKNGSWTHDVYSSLIDPQKPVIHPITLISKPEAQEPASAAITDDGYTMITMEDGWNTNRNVAQRYAVYDPAMKPVKPYPQLVHDGGHSGHVAAVKQRFVVFYSDEWIKGGGVDNLGSGDDVLAKIYSREGELEHTVPVAVSKTTRDWWPLVAGSKHTAMLLWQRFVDGETWSILMMAILDPATGQILKKPVQIAGNLKYYTYSAAYLTELNRFLVTGTNNKDVGFAHLYSQTGELVSTLEKLPPIMREAQIIQRHNGKQTRVAQAIEPAGVMVLTASADHLTIQEKIMGTQNWSIAGTDGIFVDENLLFLVGLSQNGLMQQFFEIK
jgi:hypothetical protein